MMRENGIVVERTREFKATTDSYHTFNIASNLLDRDFAAAEPNQKWAGYISYIWTREGQLYLAVILDQHSRRVIGLAVSNRIKRDLVKVVRVALENAVLVASLLLLTEATMTNVVEPKKLGLPGSPEF
jgi:putative transposase